jgi:hypothetical protein
MNFIQKTAVIAFATALPLVAAATKNILQFETMYGVDEKFVSTSVRGVKGDDLPWKLTSAGGSLSSDGTIKVSIKGLVIPDRDGIPSAVRGINPDTGFRAVVSCLTEAKGTIAIRNLMTAQFIATREGDAEISEKLELPKSCIAPMIFVAGSDGDWFAVTGAERQEEQ